MSAETFAYTRRYGRRNSCVTEAAVLLICSIGTAGVSHAQTLSSSPAAELQPLRVTMRDDAALSSVYFIEQSIGWAVGDRGVIWHTRDAGETWQQQPSTVDCNLTAVFFLDAARGWAVGGVHKPFSQATSGVVLRTIDGGATWTVIVPPERGIIPLLAGVRFFDARHGIAFGASGSMSPAGVFVTLNGGSTWQPFACSRECAWLTGDFVAPDAGAVAGANGRFATIADTRVMDSPLSSGSLRSLRAMRLIGPTSGWLVGDGGFVAVTNDLGRSWQAPLSELPPQVAEYFDFHAVAVNGPRVWVAGTPGSLVFHSADNGQTWDAFPTGHAAPLKSITFVDAEHGWAVGELGVILATGDGGRNWQVQHYGGKRAALLGVFSNPNRAPIEIISQQGAAEGYLTAIEFPFRTSGADPAIAPQSNDRQNTAERNRAAMLLAGATSADTAWRFPLPNDHALLTTDELAAALDRANDGHAQERLASRLARQIRMWRPEVIVTHHSSGQSGGSQPVESLLERVTLAAVAAAADEEHFADLTAAGLEPWTVKRVYGLLPAGVRGTETVATGQFSPLLGETLRDWSAASRRLTSDAHSPPDVYELALLTYAENAPQPGPSTQDGRGLFRGIALPSGGDSRRRTSTLPAGDVDQLRRMAARRRNLDELLDRGDGNPAWAAQVVQLTDGLGAESGGELFFQLAEGYRLKGRLDLAADTYYLLARTYPDHPLTERALCCLVQFYASGEAGSRLTNASSGTNVRNQAIELAAADTGADGVRQASATVPLPTGPPVISLSRDARLKRASELGKYLEASRPALFAEPSVRFPLVAAERQLGFANPAKRFFLSLGSLPQSDPWRRAARAEEWLANPSDAPPPKEIAHCTRIIQKPRLDGVFDEPFWQTAEALRIGEKLMRSAQQSDAASPGSFVRLARDEEDLYVAIQCIKSEVVAYANNEGPRLRDAELAAHDRVALRFDIDRDYTTYFELTIDHRGWTRDVAWSDTSWNPTWYVAAASDATSWTIEAAVPLSELAATAPQSREVWAVGVRRTIPRIGEQSWPAGSLERDSPEQYGLLIFD